MRIENIWMSNTDYNLYIQKDGKLYATSVTPYRAIKDDELEEVKTPLSIEMYVRAKHLFTPTESFFTQDLSVYGLEV